MAKPSTQAAPAPTVQTVTAYAVIPGPVTEAGWTVVKFEVELPADHQRLYENTNRALASVYASQVIGRESLLRE